jgi:hypothetical protein
MNGSGAWLFITNGMKPDINRECDAETYSQSETVETKKI